MLVIDGHAHPPRRGFKLIDDSVYHYPGTNEVMETGCRHDLDSLVRQMDERGVDRSLLMAFPPELDPLFHYGETNPETGVTTWSSHRWITEAIAAYPDRIIGHACVNPLLGESINEVERLVKEGMSGVKLHPCYHKYEVYDERLYRFYSAIEALNVPLAFHMGYDPARDIDRLRYENPIGIDDVAADFRDLKLVICHMGGNWYQEGVMVAKRNPNVWVDISGIHESCEIMVYPEVEPKALLLRVIEILGDEKVIYGTDNLHTRMNPEFIHDLGLPQRSVENIMGLNLQRLLES